MSGTPILVIVVLVSGVLDWLFAGESDADRVGLGRVDGDDLLAGDLVDPGCAEVILVQDRLAGAQLSTPSTLLTLSLPAVSTPAR